MDKCKDCIHYNRDNTYEGTGYCDMWDIFTKDDDNCEESEGD